jgi:hypothetical protein
MGIEKFKKKQKSQNNNNNSVNMEYDSSINVDIIVINLLSSVYISTSRLNEQNERN